MLVNRTWGYSIHHWQNLCQFLATEFRNGSCKAPSRRGTTSLVLEFHAISASVWKPCREPTTRFHVQNVRSFFTGCSQVSLNFIIYIYMKQQSWVNQTKLGHREHGHVILQHVSASRVITNPIYNNQFLSKHSSFVAGLGFRFSMITYIPTYYLFI